MNRLQHVRHLRIGAVLHLFLQVGDQVVDMLRGGRAALLELLLLGFLELVELVLQVLFHCDRGAGHLLELFELQIDVILH